MKAILLAIAVVAIAAGLGACAPMPDYGDATQGGLFVNEPPPPVELSVGGELPEYYVGPPPFVGFETYYVFEGGRYVVKPHWRHHHFPVNWWREHYRHPGHIFPGRAGPSRGFEPQGKLFGGTQGGAVHTNPASRQWGTSTQYPRPVQGPQQGFARPVMPPAQMPSMQRPVGGHVLMQQPTRARPPAPAPRKSPPPDKKRHN